MRLLDVQTYELRTFYGDQIPPYVILSHTWLQDHEEVTFTHLHDRTETWDQLPGARKLIFTCQQAIQHGHAWSWIDTCCIDKRNSSELSEAINSMFQWYKNAELCYVYLTDIDLRQGGDYLNSRWWTRAWTLQELIAPLKVDFFDMSWTRICSKASEAARISSRFYIDGQVLFNPGVVQNISVAQRMSWAAHRQASRTEDLAYSLLGLFDINMTMQYGEGNGAFVRLQKEIIRNTDDLSLIAWGLAPTEFYDPDCWFASQALGRISSYGIFADHPNDFKDCKDVVFFRRHATGVRIEEQPGSVILRAPMISSKDLPLSIARWVPWPMFWVALLPCGIEGVSYKILGLILCPHYEIGTTAIDHLRTTRYVLPFSESVATFLVASELAIKAKSMQIHIDSFARVEQHRALKRTAGYQRIVILKCTTNRISDVNFLGSDEWRITKRKPCGFSCSDRLYGADQPELVLRFSTRPFGEYTFVYALTKRTEDDCDLLKFAFSYERAYKTKLRWKQGRTSGAHQYIEFDIPGEREAIYAKLETKLIYNQSISTLTICDQTDPADGCEDDDVDSTCSNKACAAIGKAA